MNILVTGGNGQLGKSIQRVVHELKVEDKYIFLDIEELDITNDDAIENIFEKHMIDLVINCAAYTNVEEAINDVKKAYKINEYGSLNLVMCAQRFGVKTIHISTDFVFDGEKSKPYNPLDKTNPLSIYGKSKLAGENAIMKFSNVLTIRTSWLYSNYDNNFFKTMFKRIIDKKETFVVNDQVGTPTYAIDLARFIVNSIKNGLCDNFPNKIIHFSNEGCCSWYDFAKLIEYMAISKNILYNVFNDIIKPCTTEEYENKINKKLEKRPSYSVLSKNETCNIKGYKNRHWVYALEECFNEELFNLLDFYDNDFFEMEEDLLY